MIDLHVHVLPGIDDGARDLAMSREMLRQMAGIGVRRVVATPHLMEPLTPEYELRVEAALEATRELAAEFSIDLDLGYELMLEPQVVKRLEAGERSTLAGSRTVLVELPFGGWPQHAESSLFGLQVAGYVPVLAHPERYVAVQKDAELALAVASRGVVLQLTEASFAGAYGKGVQRSARVLLEEGLERGVRMVLATDAHSDGQRLTAAPAGLAWIRKHAGNGAVSGDAVVRWMTETVPEALLEDEAVPALDSGRSSFGVAQDKLAGSPLRDLPPEGRSLWRRMTGRG